MSTPEPPWLAWSAGERVVVRYRAADGTPAEALGYLTEVAADHLRLDTRHGSVRVEAGALVTGRRVPPPPRRH